jgi:hypothetical protein
MGYKRRINDARHIRKRLKKSKNSEEYVKAKRQCFGKSSYSSEKSVRAKIAEIAEVGRKGLRCYLCPYCTAWHLSSHKVDSQEFVS